MANADTPTPPSSPDPGARYRLGGRAWPVYLAALIIGCTLALAAFGNPARLYGLLAQGRYQDQIRVMGTSAHIVIEPGSSMTNTPAQAASDAFDAMRRVEALMSPYNPKSDIARLNAASAGTWVAVDPETWTVVMDALRLHRLTNGAYDITVGPLLELYKFKGEMVEQMPDQITLDEARARVGSQFLEFDREGMRLRFTRSGMSLTLASIAKGYAVDAAIAELLRHGVTNAMVEAGGEIRLLGAVPLSHLDPVTTQQIGERADASADTPPPGHRLWNTGLMHPRNPFETIRELKLTDCAVATSGDYEQFFIHNDELYSHIIDPRTGQPVHGGVVSASVILNGPCAKADALATAFCVLGEDGTRAFLDTTAHDYGLGGARIILYALGDNPGDLREIEFVVPVRPFPEPAP